MKSSDKTSRSKYLWIFRPHVHDIAPFPLCWSNKQPSSRDFSCMTEKEKSYISWLLSDSALSPLEGEILFWSHLKFLDNFENKVVEYL
jgi:hypothetical protein